MALPRLDILIRDAQFQTGTKKYSATQGIRMSEWVRYARDAQQGLLNRIFNCHSTAIHTKSATLSVTAGQAEVDIPADVHNGANIISVHYSFNGDPRNFVPLNLRSPRQEVSIQSYPSAYFIRNGKIVLTPIPSQTSSAALRINYQYVLPDLDIRRGLVTSHAPSTITFASNSTLLQETEDDLAAGYVDYICVVDKDGTIVADSIPVTSYNTSTKTISCTLTLAQDAAITNNSNWVVFGKNTTTHSQLIPICERYVTNYMALAVQMRDSNSDVATTSPLLQSIEQEILTSIETLEEDIVAIPILDTTYLDDF